MIYYFRQPDNKVEFYELYENSLLLVKANERLLTTFNDYRSVVWSVKYYNNVK